MRKFLTTVLLASIAGLCFAAGTADKIRWYSGSSFATKVLINNMSVTALGTVHGMFENGETIKVKDGYKAQISGPNGYSHSATISQQPVKIENGEVVEYANGIKFTCNSGVSPLKTEGAYNVSIPEASFTVDGTPNEAFTVTFYVADTRTYEKIDIDFSVNPNPAAEYDQLQDVIFTMSNKDANDKTLYQSLGVNPASKVTLATPAGKTIECAFGTTSTTASNLAYKATVPLGTDFSTPGTYTLTIPEGTIKHASQNSPTYYTNNAITVKYSISGNGQSTSVADRIKWYAGSTYQQKQTINNNTIQSLSRLFGMIEDGATVKVLNRPQATVTGPDHNITAEINQVRAWDDEAQSTVDLPGFQINCQGTSSTSIKVPGEYTVSIPAGAFTVNGTPCDAFSYSVIVQDMRTYKPFPGTFTVSPDLDAIQSLTYFRLSYDINDSEGNRLYGRENVQPGAYGTVTKKGGKSTKLDFKTDAGTFGSIHAFKLVFPGDFAFSEDGEYTINIPAGQMIIGSETNDEWYTNEELNYSFRLGNPGPSDPTYSTTLPAISPAQGEIPAFAGVQFESPDIDNYSMVLCPQGNTPVKFSVTLPDGSKEDFEPSSSPNLAYINVPFNKVYTESGTYKLNVPRGSFKYVDNTGKEWLTSGFDVTYSVKGGTLTGMDYTLATTDSEIPSEGATLYKLDYIYVKFAGNVTPTDMLYSKVEYPDNSVKYLRTTWSSSNQRFMIDFGFPKQKGTYKVSFPSGAARNDNGEFNKGFDFTINFIEKNTIDMACTTNPENGSTVGELFVLYLDAPAGYSEIKPYLGGITKTYFYNNDDREKRQMQYLKTSSSPTRLMITLDEAVKDKGDYTWEIPAESVLGVQTDGTQVIATPMAFFWSVREGGVVSVGMDKDASYDVYDLNGVSVIRNGSAEDLDKLDKGTYIINGKTFIIR